MTSISLEFKQELHQFCLAHAKEKINRIEKLLQSNFNDLSTASKSSAGDKHETSRAMLHLEQENYSKQLMQAQSNLKILAQIKCNPQDVIGSGALIQTNQGIFYMSVGIGELLFKETHVYLISPGSPLGQQMIEKCSPFQFKFNETEYYIEGVI